MKNRAFLYVGLILMLALGSATAVQAQEHDYGITSVISPGTGGNYQLSQLVTVTAVAKNFGTAAEPSPIKYIFNGGNAVSEMTGVLAQNATESHTFATQVQMPAVVGNYSLKVFTDLGTDANTQNDTVTINVQVVDCLRNLPFSENFDGVARPALPTCWLQQNAAGSGTWRTENYSSDYVTPHSSPNAVGLSSYTTAGRSNWLLTPAYNLIGGRTYLLNFYYSEYSTGYTNDTLEVRYGMGQDSSAMTNLLLHAFQATTAFGVYVQRPTYFIAPTTGVYSVGFHQCGASGTGWGAILDDISLSIVQEHDFGVTSAISPAPVPYQPNQMVPVTAAVKNFGTTTESSLIVYQFNGGSYVSEMTGSLAQEGGTETHTFATPIQMPATDGYYTLKVWTDVSDDGDNTNDTTTVQVHVMSCTQTLPWAENFDTATPLNLPTCWTQESALNCGTWETLAAKYRSTPNAALINSVANGRSNWLFTPAFNLTGGQSYVFSFWYRHCDGRLAYPPADSLEVKFGAAPDSNAMTTAIGTRFQTPDDIYSQFLHYFTPPTTGVYTIGIHQGSASGNGYGSVVDDISLAMVQPHDFGVTAITSPAALPVYYQPNQMVTVTGVAKNFGSTTEGSPIRYQFNGGPVVEETTGSLVLGAMESHSFATQIQMPAADGPYTLKVWTNVTGDGNHANDTATVSVQVHNCMLSVPMSQNFDGVTAPNMPYCWTQQSAGSGTWVTTTSYAHSASNGLYNSTYSSEGRSNWLFSPSLNLTGGQVYALNFWYRELYTGSYFDTLEVMFGTTWDSLAMTNTAVPRFPVSSTTYAQNLTYFTAPATGNYVLGFHAVSASGNGYCPILDDISLVTPAAHDYSVTSVTSPLPTPIFYQPNQIVPVTAVIKNFGTSTETSPIKYVFNGGDPVAETTASLAPLATQTYTFGTPISMPATDGSYTLKVWTDVAGDGVHTNDTVTVSMQVRNCTVAVPWAQAFDSTSGSSLPNCWFTQTASGSGNWITGTMNPHSTPRSAYIGALASYGRSSWMITPFFNLTAGQTYALKFWYREYTFNASYHDSMEVKIGTGQDSLTMTNAVVASFQANSATYAQSITYFTVPTTGSYAFGFHASTTGSGSGEILDDISLTIPAAHDYSVTSVTSPLPAPIYYQPNQIVPVTAVARNFGLTTESSPIRYMFNGGAPVTDTTASLATLATETHTFATQIQMPATDGTYILKVWTDVADDAVHANDTATVNVQVYGCTRPLPWAEAFDGVTQPALPNCWFTQTATGSGAWKTSTSYYRSSPNSALIGANASAGRSSWLFSPSFNFTGGQTYALSFWYREYSTGTYYDSLEVTLGTAQDSATVSSIVVPRFRATSTTYAQSLQYFTPAATGSYVLGFHAATRGAGYGQVLDDIKLTIPPPDDYSVTSVTSPVPLPAWYAPGSMQTVTAVVKNFGSATGASPIKYMFNNGDPVTETTASLAPFAIETHTFSAQITMPAANGLYTLKVWTDLTGDTIHTNDTVTVSVQVYDCAPPRVLPWTEGFESTVGTGLPLCWIARNYDADAYLWTSATTQHHAGSRSMYHTAVATGTTPNDWAFSPAFNLSHAWGYNFDAWVREGSTNANYFDSLKVVLTTSQDNGAVVATVLPATRLTSTTFADFTAPIFSPPANGTYYLAFIYMGTANSGGIYLDDASLSGHSLCTPDTVADLTVYLVNEQDIRLGWTPRVGFLGTYSIYSSTTWNDFPGTWSLVAGGIAPDFGVNGNVYVDVNGAGSDKKYYLVIGVCGDAGPAAVSSGSNGGAVIVTPSPVVGSATEDRNPPPTSNSISTQR